MTEFTPCRHLDFIPGKYDRCEIREHPFFPGVWYWHRQWVPYETAPRNVQFCGKSKGRINGIFQCYSESECSSCTCGVMKMHCFEGE